MKSLSLCFQKKNKHMVQDSKFVFEAKTIQRMELLVMSTLEWRMNPVTPLSFLDHIIRRLEFKTDLRWKFFKKCEDLILSVVVEGQTKLSASSALYSAPFYRTTPLIFIISGLQNFDRDNVASVVTAADKGGATHVDIACDPDLVKLATSLTSLPICVSSVDPAAFPAAVEAGALMVEIGNYDSFYEMGVIFPPEEILKLTRETKRILPSVALSVTVPHTLSLPDQIKLAEQLEQEGVDVIQTEGGKCSSPTKSGVLGLIEKATPTLAAAYSVSRAVKIPVMCSSGLSAVTAPMAITAGAAGVGVGSAINKLNDIIAMIAEVRSIATSLQVCSDRPDPAEINHLKM